MSKCSMLRWQLWDDDTLCFCGRLSRNLLQNWARKAGNPANRQSRWYLLAWALMSKFRLTQLALRGLRMTLMTATSTLDLSRRFRCRQLPWHIPPPGLTYSTVGIVYVVQFLCYSLCLCHFNPNLDPGFKENPPPITLERYSALKKYAESSFWVYYRS